MKKMTNFEKLNKRISFFRKEPFKNSFGQNKFNDIEIMKSWASIHNQTFQDIKTNMGTELEDTITIIIRAKQKEEIITSYLIKYQNESYKILNMTRGVQNGVYTMILARKET
jgi:head-tail adaptor